MKRREFTLGVGAGALGIVAALAGCNGRGSQPGPGTGTRAALGPRAITSDEANRLAVARFRNYERGVVPVTIEYADRERRAHFVGRVDYSAGVGVVDLVENERPTGAVAWNLQSLALLDGRAAASAKSFPLSGWTTRRLDYVNSLVDGAFGIVLNLGFDRPENPLLLQRNGATWEGSTQINGHAVDRITGPIPTGASQSSLTYYIDAQGTLIRVQAKLNAGEGQATIDFADGAAPAIPDLTGFLPAPTASPAASATPRAE